MKIPLTPQLVLNIILLTHLTKILSMLRLHIQGFVPSETLKEWQIQMTALLHQQHSRGGTITVVADDVIDETWVGIYNNCRECMAKKLLINLYMLTNSQGQKDEVFKFFLRKC